MVKRTALPFEEQRSYEGALFLIQINVEQLERLFIEVIGFDERRARLIPFIVNQYGLSAQPAKGGRVVVLMNADYGYDVALDVF
jgi:hypothetical protein